MSRRTSIRRTSLNRVAAATLTLAALALIAAKPAVAQESEPGWQFAGAVYLWGAGLGGETRSGSEIEVSFGDIADNLDAAFMGAFEARRDRWSFLADVIYMDIAAEKSVPVSIPGGPGLLDVTADANLELTGWVLHFTGAYSVLAEEDVTFNLLGGVRYLDLDMALLVRPTSPRPLPARGLARAEGVLDGIVGMRGNIALGDRWYLPYYFDAGTGQSHFSWQALGGVGFRAARWLDLAFTYRHLDWSFKSDFAVKDLNFSGPAGGAIIRF